MAHSAIRENPNRDEWIPDSLPRSGGQIGETATDWTSSSRPPGMLMVEAAGTVSRRSRVHREVLELAHVHRVNPTCTRNRHALVLIIGRRPFRPFVTGL